MGPPNLVDRQHGAGAHQAIRWQIVRQGSNARERIRRVQRNLDHADAGGEHDSGDVGDALGQDAAQYRDQRIVS
jgi:hypothetical protein